jgi:hypothetical protein
MSNPGSVPPPGSEPPKSPGTAAGASPATPSTPSPATPAATDAAAANPTPAAMAEAPIVFETLSSADLTKVLEALKIPEDTFRAAAKVLKAVDVNVLLREIGDSKLQGLISLFLPAGLVLAGMNLINPPKNLPNLEELRKQLAGYLDSVKKGLTSATEVKTILIEELSKLTENPEAQAAANVDSKTGIAALMQSDSLVKKRIAELESKTSTDAASTKRAAILRAYYEHSDLPGGSHVISVGHPIVLREKMLVDLAALKGGADSAKKFTDKKLNKIGKSAALFLFARIYALSHFQKPSQRMTKAMADEHYYQVSVLTNSLNKLMAKQGWFSKLAISLHTKLAEFAGVAGVQSVVQNTKKEVSSVVKDLVTKREELEKQIKAATVDAVKKAVPSVTGAVENVLKSAGGQGGLLGQVSQLFGGAIKEGLGSLGKLDLGKIVAKFS